MTDLERYRDEIDEIDSEIVRLFEKRMKVSEEVAEYKIKTGKQVLDPARESQKIHVFSDTYNCNIAILNTGFNQRFLFKIINYKRIFSYFSYFTYFFLIAINSYDFRA